MGGLEPRCDDSDCPLQKLLHQWEMRISLSTGVLDGAAEHGTRMTVSGFPDGVDEWRRTAWASIVAAEYRESGVAPLSNAIQESPDSVNILPCSPFGEMRIEFYIAEM
jgi:hypothetical protein